MNTELLNRIEAFASLKVLVIGEAMLDSYLQGTTGRLCREAPVPVVDVFNRQDVPGGAANTAVNLACLGSRVNFLSVVGDDIEGKLLRQSLEEQGVSTEHVLMCPSRRTIAKHRVVAASQILVRFDQGSTEPIERETEQSLIERLDSLFPRCDALVISDYAYGIFTPRLIQALTEWQARAPRIIVADSKNLANYQQVGVTAVKPNYEEVIRLLGLPRLENERTEQLANQGERVLELSGAHIAAVTVDTEGALIFERGSSTYRTYAQPMTHSQATGAGDTYVSALTLALAGGAQTTAAAELASAAAAVVVAKKGTATCSNYELGEYFSTRTKFIADKVQLANRLEQHRRQGQPIVFTNGCFDLLHRGHITYLSQAKALGEVLVVGLNSDEGVRRLKGPDRPINSQEDRVQVLAALSCVDYLTIFDEDTSAELIEVLKPDIYVKGGDYSRAKLPEAELVEQQGGEVVLLPYLPNRSTSGIIERIYQIYEQSVKRPA